MRLAISRDFHLLWTGESVSAIGSQFSILALPTLAILQLHTGPVAVGVLTGCGFAGYPIAGVMAGPLVDRSSKRTILLVTNGGRALLLALVVADAMLGRVALWHLALAALLVSGATAVFDAAYQTLLPSVVPADRLLGANARLETSQSLAYFVGPATAGFVMQALGVVAAVATDALSYILALLTIQR
jgi:MFS family permease